MRIKNLLLLLIGSLVISGITAVNKENAVAGEVLGSNKVVSTKWTTDSGLNRVIAAKGYTADEIRAMSEKYFLKDSNKNGAIVDVDSEDGDKVTIHIYEYYDNIKGEGRTVTYNWYYISKKTGQGEDFFGNKINLVGKSEKKAEKMHSAAKVTIGDITYELIAKKQGNSEKVKVKDIVQTSKPAGKKVSLVKKVTSEKVVTNGKQLYYSKNVNNKGVVYRLDISTGKSHKVISGKGYVLLGGTDKNLYIGVSSAKNKSGYDKYTYNLKAKKLITVYD